MNTLFLLDTISMLLLKSYSNYRRIREHCKTNLIVLLSLKWPLALSKDLGSNWKTIVKNKVHTINFIVINVSRWPVRIIDFYTKGRQLRIKLKK